MRICVFALVALVGGCHWDLNDKGTDPLPNQFYFPSGIAMDPAGRIVYVANGNADLKFGGGTVMMVDTLAFECTVARFRKTMPAGPTDQAVTWPEVCGEETQYDAYVTGGRCLRDALDPSIVDCDETAFILPDTAVRIGNFAGSIRVQTFPDDVSKVNDRRLFVAVRGDPSVTWIDVHLDQAKKLDCDQPATKVPAPCDVSHLVQQFVCKDQPTCSVGTDKMGLTQLPTEPFGMALDLHPDLMINRLLVSSLATGQVSVIDIDKLSPASPPPDPTDPINSPLVSESIAFFSPDSTGRHGAFALAPKTPIDSHGLWYMTSNVNPQIATFHVGESNVIIPSTTFAINSSFAAGNDVRDLAFDVDGNRAFVTENNPPSVVVIDTRMPPGSNGAPTNTVTDVIDVCQTPSHMGVRRFFQAGAPGAPTQVKTKLVVVCFLSSQVMIVDPDRPGVDDTTFSGFVGPDDIAFNFPSDGDNSQTQLWPQKHAYVTNYSDSTLAVLDLDPNSPTENRVIARLGFPPDGFNP